MPAIKVTQNYFGASGRLYGSDGLGAVIRGIAIDNARIKIMTSNVPDLTDNSTGVATAALVALAVPTEFDASTADGASQAEFKVAIVKIEDAGKVLATSVTNARTILGLSAVAAASGTQAAANTIPGITQVVVEEVGSDAVDFTSGRVAIAQAKSNLERLLRAVNEVFVAIGADPIGSDLKTQGSSGENLTAISVVKRSAVGSTSHLSKVDANAFLANMANNIATIAKAWNKIMTQGAAAVTAAPLNVVAS